MTARIAIACTLFLAIAACSDPPPAATTGAVPPPAASLPGAPPRIDSIVPGETRAGVVFNAQPSGSAAISVVGIGFVRGAVVTANGQKLETTFGNEGWVTAVVPSESYSRAGRIAILVTNPDGAVTNSKDFEVKP